MEIQKDRTEVASKESLENRFLSFQVSKFSVGFKEP
jgi:hypothetical protein